MGCPIEWVCVWRGGGPLPGGCGYCGIAGILGMPCWIDTVGGCIGIAREGGPEAWVGVMLWEIPPPRAMLVGNAEAAA